MSPSTELPASPTSIGDKIIFDSETLHDDLEITEVALNSDIEEDSCSVSYKAIPTSANRSSTSSVSFLDFDKDQEKKVSLPAMEIVIRNLGLIQQRLTKEPVKMKQPKLETSAVNYSMETPVDIEMYSSSLTQTVDLKTVPVNHLGPREQEEAGSPILKTHLITRLILILY